MRFNGTFFLDAMESWGAFAFKCYMATLRWRYVDWQKDFAVHRKHDPVIWSFWHGQLLLPAFVDDFRDLAAVSETEGVRHRQQLDSPDACLTDRRDMAGV